jgi:ABC-2 type transport system ATP-binding protein
VERRKTKFGKLSKGLKRRAVIAAAMVHQPEIVFLDEPTAGLDVMSALSLREFLRELRAEDTTVFLTTHYIEEADQLSDRITILVKGKITTLDTSENIKRSVRGTPVIDAFLSTEPSAKVFEELKRLGNVELNGRRIKIETVNTSEAIESLVQSTSKNGIRVEEINTIEPTLENAFVKLTGVTPETMKIEKERGRR